MRIFRTIVIILLLSGHGAFASGSDKGAAAYKRGVKEAFKWYSKSAVQGHAEAQTNLGDFYLLGLGQLRAHKT